MILLQDILMVVSNTMSAVMIPACILVGFWAIWQLYAMHVAARKGNGPTSMFKAFIAGGVMVSFLYAINELGWAFERMAGGIPSEVSARVFDNVLIGRLVGVGVLMTIVLGIKACRQQWAPKE